MDYLVLISIIVLLVFLIFFVLYRGAVLTRHIAREIHLMNMEHQQIISEVMGVENV